MDANFFTNNRYLAMQQLSGGIAVLSAYTALQRTNDAAQRFEQESNFWWLSGISEPDWVIVIDSSTESSWLIAPEVGDSQHIFDGSLSSKDAQIISGITKVIPAKEGDTLLRNLAKKHSVVKSIGEHPHAEYFSFFENPAHKRIRLRLERIFNAVHDFRKDLASLRAIKQPQEIVAIKKAIAVTVEGFELVKSQLHNLRYEYEIEAEFDYLFKKHDARHAYDPIIASGINGCTLHYSRNHDKLRSKDLILIDVGARVDGYAADITRTFAKNEPTKRQQHIHNVTRDSHLKIIELLKPNLSIVEYSAKADAIMTDAIKELGLHNDSGSLRRYFPHAVSHGLGVDVHDSLGAPLTFKAGMVLTVEPGIYIPEEKIGVRIEDDLIITHTGATNLSKTLSTGW